MKGVSVTFEDISEVLPDHEKPILDRSMFDQELQRHMPLTNDQQFWRDNGYLILNNFIPNELIDNYCNYFETTVPSKEGGFGIGTPYMIHMPIRDLCLYKPLMDKMKELIGHDMGMHLNLTGWKSTERNWHQDDYLNPPQIKSHYAAVWFALDDIHPDSGPFQFVPGSHKWPLVRRDKVLSFVDSSEAADPTWPKTTERFVVPAFEEKMSRHNLPQHEFIAKKGDVLIWHGVLAHRGSAPKNPELWRKTCITHFSSLTHRTDMPRRQLYQNGQSEGFYFVL